MTEWVDTVKVNTMIHDIISLALPFVVNFVIYFFVEDLNCFSCYLLSRRYMFYKYILERFSSPTFNW